jgi:hypothetical protein
MNISIAMDMKIGVVSHLATSQNMIKRRRGVDLGYSKEQD